MSFGEPTSNTPGWRRKTPSLSPSGGRNVSQSLTENWEGCCGEDFAFWRSSATLMHEECGDAWAQGEISALGPAVVVHRYHDRFDRVVAEHAHADHGQRNSV